MLQRHLVEEYILYSKQYGLQKSIPPNFLSLLCSFGEIKFILGVFIDFKRSFETLKESR